MKVLFISEYYPPLVMGGGEINLKQVAEALAKSKMDISVLTSGGNGLKIEETVRGVKIYRNLKTGEKPQGIINNLKRSLVFPSSIVRETIKLQRKHKFDRIHFMGTSIIAAKELRKLKVPLFATIESYPALCPKGDRMYCGEKECKQVCSWSKFIFCQLHSSEIGKTRNSWYLKYNPLSWRYIYNSYKKLNHSLKYCRLIAISEYVQKVLLQHKHQSVVIPNIIDFEMFKQIKSKWKVKPFSQRTKSNKIKIIYLGSLTKYKGPQVLIKAINGIDCRCDLYGEGPLKEELEEMIKRKRLDAKIHAPVPYEKIPEIYAQADLVIFPSIWPEPFGRIAIEAMAAGKPVIGSEIGGIKDTIGKGAGLYFSSGKALELNQILQKINKNGDPSLTVKIKDSVKTLRRQFSPEAVTIKLINNYKKMNL